MCYYEVSKDLVWEASKYAQDKNIDKFSSNTKKNSKEQCKEITLRSGNEIWVQESLVKNTRRRQRKKRSCISRRST